MIDTWCTDGQHSSRELSCEQQTEASSLLYKPAAACSAYDWLISCVNCIMSYICQLLQSIITLRSDSLCHSLCRVMSLISLVFIWHTSGNAANDLHWLMVAFSALTLLVGRQEEHLARKNMGGGGVGHWLVRMEWRRAGWSMCLPLLIFPCTMKSRSSLLAPAHPGSPGKRVVKRLWDLHW